MKKTTFLIFVLLATVACKDNTKKENKTVVKEQNNPIVTNTKTYRGEFIHLKDGSVLYGNKFIYGVVLNEKEADLAKRVSTIKKDSLDMVPVVVKGILNKKKPGEEGWDERLTITEIILVGNKPSSPDIKVESKK